MSTIKSPMYEISEQNILRKIVMVGTSPATQGGISAVINTLAEAGLFKRMGVRYIVSHCDGGRFQKISRAVLGWCQLLGMLCSLRVGLIHVHMASRASFWRKSFYLVLAVLFRVPYVIHLHGAEFKIFYGRESSARVRYCVRRVFQGAATVIVLSDSWKVWVDQQFPGVKSRVLHNPVQVPDVLPEWENRKMGRVLFLGRLGRRKGVYDLVQVADILKQRGYSFVIMLGGDGDVSAIRAEARKLHVEDCIDVLGWVRGKQKQDLLASAMVYILPSYNEGLPVSVLEAMAAGLPVVTTSVGGLPELVSEGNDGYLVVPGDVDSLADRLGMLLSHPEVAQRMGNAAFEKIRHGFSVEVFMPELMKIYADVGCLEVR